MAKDDDTRSSGEESLESIDDGYGKPLKQIKCMPSDLTIEKQAAKEVTKLLEKHENAAVARFLKRYLENWRQQKVCIAIYGDKDHGKSTLINTLRGTNSIYSLSSSCTSPMPYVYPYNSNVQFWELPPIAKEGRYKRDKYMKEINADRYDLILVLTANTFRMTSSCWLAKQFAALKKGVIYVRTKTDEGMNQDALSHPHTHNPSKTLARLRKLANDSLRDNAIETKFLYLIGAAKPHDYDFPDMINALVDQLPTEKRDAFTLSMIPVNAAVIAKKWEILNSRIWVLACASAASGQPVKGCESKAEIDLMLEEIRFYRKQLGAQEDAFRKVRDADKSLLGGLDKVRYTKEGIETLIAQAEEEGDADQFVVSMKIVALRWWMSHLQVGISFSSSAGVLRFLLHNLQIIGLKFLRVQEDEKAQKQQRREKAIEQVKTGKSSIMKESLLESRLRSARSSSSSDSDKSKKKTKKLNETSEEKEKRRAERRAKKALKEATKEDSGQGSCSGDENETSKLKKKKKSKEGKEKKEKKEKKKKKKAEEVKVFRITKVIDKDHLNEGQKSLSTISEESAALARR